MKKFKIKYVTPNGAIEEALGMFQTKEEALKEYRERGMTPIKVSKEGGFDANDIVLTKTLPNEKIADFLENMGDTLEAGVPLITATEDILKRVKSGYYKQVVRGVDEDLRKGIPLSDAMTRFPTVFDESAINLTRAGEHSGKTSEILLALAEKYRKSGDFKKSLLASLVYPAMIVVVSIVVIYTIVQILMPTVSEMYTQIDGDLPFLTTFVVGIVDWFKTNFLIIVLGLVVLTVSMVLILNTPKTRYYFDALLLKLPFIKNLILTYETYKIAYLLSTLIDGGVTVDTSLEIASRVVKNRKIAKEVVEVKRDVENNGTSLSEAFNKTKHAMPVFIQNLSSGERTGALTGRLMQLSKRLEKDLNKYLEAIKKTLSPVLIVVLAIPVGILLMAVIAPIYGMMEFI